MMIGAAIRKQSEIVCEAAASRDDLICSLFVLKKHNIKFEYTVRFQNIMWKLETLYIMMILYCD